MTDILLRNISMADLDSVLYIFSHRQSCLNCGIKPVTGPEQGRALIEKMMNGRTTFAVVLKEKMETVGFVSVSKDIHRCNNRRYMLSYIIVPEYRRQGIMTDALKKSLRFAFLNLGADVVSAACFSDNKASGELLKKCGFSYEGCIRKEFVRYDGQILDSLMYSMIYEEYKELYEE